MITIHVCGISFSAHSLRTDPHEPRCAASHAVILVAGQLHADIYTVLDTGTHTVTHVNNHTDEHLHPGKPPDRRPPIPACVMHIEHHQASLAYRRCGTGGVPAIHAFSCTNCQTYRHTHTVSQTCMQSCRKAIMQTCRPTGRQVRRPIWWVYAWMHVFMQTCLRACSLCACAHAHTQACMHQ